MVSDQISWSCGCHFKFPQTKTNLNSKRSCPKSNNIPSRIGRTPLSMCCDSQIFFSYLSPYQIHGLCSDRLELFWMAESSQKKVTNQSVINQIFHVHAYVYDRTRKVEPYFLHILTPSINLLTSTLMNVKKQFWMAKRQRFIKSWRRLINPSINNNFQQNQKVSKLKLFCLDWEANHPNGNNITKVCPNTSTSI